MTTSVATALPSYEALLATVACAEHAEGWLARCADAGCYLALNAPFVAALADVLRPLATDAHPVLEVCAGDGALAAALRESGVPVVATDVCPPPHADGVQGMSARDALDAFAPRVVLGAFVPFDARVDEAVLGHASVHDYIVVNARLGGTLGAPSLWSTPGWGPHRLDAVTRWTVTRHDAWLRSDLPVLRRGEAWRLRRVPAAEPPFSSAAVPQGYTA